MAKAPKIYTRLTRNAPGLGSYSSLWLAHDHLMIVRSTGYNESYTRIQLSDIKAVFLVAGERRRWWALIWLIIFGWSGVLFAIGLGDRDVPYVSGIFLALGTTGLIWNHLLGPSCRAYVVTGVQTAPLPSLVRRKKARHVLARLEPLVAAAQADLVVAPAVVVEPPVAATAPATEAPAAQPIAVAPATAEAPGEAAPNPPATG